MAKKDGDTNYNTNLASEYLMMSLLCRAGKDAYLSLGNKKGVDIVVTHPNKSHISIEVKGVNSKSDPWPVGGGGVFRKAENLFYALVCFNSDISDITQPADFWLIPSNEIFKNKSYSVAKNGKMVYLLKTAIRIPVYEKYKNNLDHLNLYLSKK